MKFELNVRPSSEHPSPEDEEKEAILFNPCDGYYIAHHIMFNDDGSFEGFYDFMMSRFVA